MPGPASLPLFEGFSLEPEVAAHRRGGHPHKVAVIVAALAIFQLLAWLGVVAMAFA